MPGFEAISSRLFVGFAESTPICIGRDFIRRRAKISALGNHQQARLGNARRRYHNIPAMRCLMRSLFNGEYAEHQAGVFS